MKYRAKCKHCVSHIKNITKYADAHIQADRNNVWIEVDSEAEAAMIEIVDHQFEKAIKRYKELIELTLQ